MKSLFTTLAILVIIGVSSAQNIAVGSYIEQTQVGPKIGTSIGFNTSMNVEFGGFYQKAVEQVAPEGVRPWTYEREFYGAYFNYPIVEGNITALKFNVRTGVTNGENFLITPSLLGSISPVKAVKIGAGLGMRAFRPTLRGSISIKLGGGSNNKRYLASK